MLTTLLMIIHLIVCFFLIVIVLIQGGKGAEMGAAFGGSSQTLFGARGAATVFSKLTTVSAILFMITSFALAIVTSKGSSVMQNVPAATQPEQPKIPQGATGPIQGSQPVQPSAPGQQPAAPAAPAQGK